MHADVGNVMTQNTEKAATQILMSPMVPKTSLLGVNLILSKSAEKLLKNRSQKLFIFVNDDYIAEQIHPGCVIYVCRRASHTTRSRYADEVAGKDYYFVSLDAFERGIKMVCSDVFSGCF